MGVSARRGRGVWVLKAKTAPGTQAFGHLPRSAERDGGCSAVLWSWGTGGPLSRAGPGCLIPLSLLLTLGNWTASLPTHPRPPAQVPEGGLGGSPGFQRASGVAGVWWAFVFYKSCIWWDDVGSLKASGWSELRLFFFPD